MPSIAKSTPISLAVLLGTISCSAAAAESTDTSVHLAPRRSAVAAKRGHAASHVTPQRTTNAARSRAPRRRTLDPSHAINTDAANQPATTRQTSISVAPNQSSKPLSTARADNGKNKLRLPLKLGSRNPSSPSQADQTLARTASRTILTVSSSLAIVLGLFFACVCLARRGTRGAMAQLPEGVVEVLGKSSLAGRQQLYLVRLGNKLLLLCVSAGGTETLAEISDAMEIDRIVGLCRQKQPGSVSSTFRQVLNRLSQSAGKDSNQPPHYLTGRPRAAAKGSKTSDSIGERQHV